ncbi:hypothetical protein BH23ACT9_BH23ACT9_28370 [soil metagenome]
MAMARPLAEAARAFWLTGATGIATVQVPARASPVDDGWPAAGSAALSSSATRSAATRGWCIECRACPPADWCPIHRYDCIDAPAIPLGHDRPAGQSSSSRCAGRRITAHRFSSVALRWRTSVVEPREVHGPPRSVLPLPATSSPARAATLRPRLRNPLRSSATCLSTSPIRSAPSSYTWPLMTTQSSLSTSSSSPWTSGPEQPAAPTPNAITATAQRLHITSERTLAPSAVWRLDRWPLEGPKLVTGVRFSSPAPPKAQLRPYSRPSRTLLTPPGRPTSPPARPACSSRRPATRSPPSTPGHALTALPPATSTDLLVSGDLRHPRVLRRPVESATSGGIRLV